MTPSLRWASAVEPTARQQIAKWLWRVYGVRVEWVADDRCTLHGARAEEASDDVLDVARDLIEQDDACRSGAVVGEA